MYKVHKAPRILFTFSEKMVKKVNTERGGRGL